MSALKGFLCTIIGNPLPPPEPREEPFLLTRRAFPVLLPTKRDEHGRYTWTPTTFAPPPICKEFPC